MKIMGPDVEGVIVTRDATGHITVQINMDREAACALLFQAIGGLQAKTPPTEPAASARDTYPFTD